MVYRWPNLRVIMFVLYFVKTSDAVEIGMHTAMAFAFCSSCH